MDYKKYVEETSDCKYINSFRKSGRVFLELECGCDLKTKFEIDIYKFKTKKVCNICSSKIRGNKRTKTYDEKELEDLYFKTTGFKVKIISIKKEEISKGQFRNMVYFKYLMRGFEEYVFNTRIDRFKNGRLQLFKGHDGIYRRYSGKVKTHKDFEKELNEKRKGIFTILSKYKGTFENIKVKNNICGHEFETNATNLISSKKVSCPICNFSKMEETIYQNLKDNNIEFIYQHKFRECRNIRPLPFDFYLPTHNIIIEADGKQHSEITTGYFGGLEGYLDRKKKDLIKNKFCRKNNIKLIRISYLEANKIKNIIKYGIKI